MHSKPRDAQLVQGFAKLQRVFLSLQLSHAFLTEGWAGGGGAGLALALAARVVVVVVSVAVAVAVDAAVDAAAAVDTASKAAGGGDTDGDEVFAIHVKGPVRPGARRRRGARSVSLPASRPLDFTKLPCLWVYGLDFSAPDPKPQALAECPKCPIKVKVGITLTHTVLW